MKRDMNHRVADETSIASTQTSRAFPQRFYRIEVSKPPKFREIAASCTGLRLITLN